MIKIDLEKYRELSRLKKKENKNFYHRLKNLKAKDLDEKFQNLHEKTFAKIDCLTCANCCKTTGPLFTHSDITRISKYLGLKPQAFKDQYLREDEDWDFVLKETPCAFLEEDNSCGIYEFRPKACREYPHTDQFKMHQVLELTRRNLDICPAVYEITEELKKEIK